MFNPIVWWRQRRQRRQEHRKRLLDALARGVNHYGFGLMQETGLRSSALYPLLDELMAEGVVETYMEPDPGDRPPRVLYRLTSWRASPPPAVPDA